MEKYNAWIKELSSIVYDNSKSEYQILSELIPILLNIKSSQDTNSELMDTIHESIFTKVSELESGMNTFSETFIGKLNEFKQEFSPGLEEFTTTLANNISEFKEKINNKISAFNTTYASTKASIKDTADSINNINDTLISGYNEILDKINNFVEPIINSASGNIIDSAIEEKFTPTYLARESIYIDLVSVTTQPTSANEGDIYYNASEYQLYKYTGGAWVKENYTTNKLYRYQNNLYYIDIIQINKEIVISGRYLSAGSFIDENHVLAYSSNYGLRVQFVVIDLVNKTTENHSMVTPPEGYTSTSSFSWLQCIDNKYYFQYSNNNVNSIAISDDLENWTYLCPLTGYSAYGKLKKINGYLVSDGRYYYDEESNTFKDWSQTIYGYLNGYYYAMGDDYIRLVETPQYNGQYVKQIDIPYTYSDSDYPLNFYQMGKYLIIGRFVLINDELYSYSAGNKQIIFNNDLNLYVNLASGIAFNNGNLYQTSIEDNNNTIQYIDINNSATTNIIVDTYDGTNITSFNYVLGLVAYE